MLVARCMVFSCRGMDLELSDDDYGLLTGQCRRALPQIYAKFSLANLERFDETLQKYAGWRQSLEIAMCRKYDVSATFVVSVMHGNVVPTLFETSVAQRERHWQCGQRSPMKSTSRLVQRLTCLQRTIMRTSFMS